MAENKEHLCNKCKESSFRTVGSFVETNCRHFPSVRPQVDGMVTDCLRFDEMDTEKEKG